MIARLNPRLLALLAALMLVLGAAPHAPGARAAAGATLDLFDRPSTGWLSVRNMGVAAHQELFEEQSAAGMMMIDAERIEIGGQLRVSSVWQSNADGRAWASRSNLTDAQFDEYWAEYSRKGMRLIDQDAYLVGGAIRYAGIWMDNKEGLAWASYQGQPDQLFSETFAKLSEAGMMMVDVESYVLGDVRLYSSIWVANSDNLGWIERRDMTGDQYAAYFDEYARAGYRVIDLESYMLGNGAQRYAAIWFKNTSGRGWFAYRDMTARGFGNRWNQLRDAGYRLIDFEVYDTDGGTRYAGVWRQNTGRPDWRPKGRVDGLAESYAADNDLAGMAVAIAVKGKLVYLRGFGHADIAQDRWFHSGTIARAASGCKAVAGVLGLELQELGLVDLDTNTRTLAPALPAFHTHTLRQLLSNRAGVRHYVSGDATSNVNVQYDWQTTAAGLFAADPLLFAPGTDYGYSTHGYTLLGAALEGATGDPTSEILRDRLAVPHGLPTLRAEDRSVPNANRATLYTGTNSGPQTVIPDNISWKLLGGGCELSTVDYARLGAKLLGGSILSQASLDELWTAPDGQSNYALGWDTGTHLGERVVAKSGAQTGAASYIRIYPDQEIVIAILSNQRGHTPRNLALQIGELLLSGAGAGLPDTQAAASPAQADEDDAGPHAELGEPDLGVPATIILPPTLTDYATEPDPGPSPEAAAGTRLFLPLLRR